MDRRRGVNMLERYRRRLEEAEDKRDQAKLAFNQATRSVAYWKEQIAAEEAENQEAQAARSFEVRGAH